MNYSLTLLSAYLSVSSVLCSTITVGCDANSDDAFNYFKVFMQDFLNHSTEIWQCYKDHLKVNNPGYKYCIDNIKAMNEVKAVAKVLDKNAFGSKNDWRISIYEISNDICEEMNSIYDSDLFSLKYRSPKKAVVTGGDFNNISYLSDSYSSVAVEDFNKSPSDASDTFEELSKVPADDSDPYSPVAVANLNNSPAYKSTLWSTKSTIIIAVIAVLVVLVAIATLIYFKSPKFSEKQDVTDYNLSGS